MAASVSAAIDAALSNANLELSEKEQNFQQCMRRRAEREARAKLEAEEKKVAEQKLCAAAMEAAFEGDLPALLKAFDAGVTFDAADGHGTTLLSEAAGGGQAEMVELLLAEGADPNSRGRYGRTPLWRAAFSGSEEATRELLRGGGDPREPDSEGVRPIAVANGPAVRTILACWDTSVTDEAMARLTVRRQTQVRNAVREQEEKLKAQKTEFNDAIREAERKVEIGRAEVATQQLTVREYRKQKALLAEQGQVSALQETEKLLLRAEGTLKEAEHIVLELDWKLQRVRLKRRDWESEQARRQLKKLGRMPGFRVEVPLDGPDAFAALLSKLSNDLELQVDLQVEGENAVTLKRGDVALLEGPLLEGKLSKEDLQHLELESVEWPASIWFNHGFDLTIRLRELSDVVFKDPGGLRQADGRWPLVVDPTGTGGKFFTYSGASKFTLAELQCSAETGEMDDRLRLALLKGLMHGGAIIIDLEAFQFSIETVAVPFNRLEPNLFDRLTDRSVLYSYLLPRRFMSLTTAEEREKDFAEYVFVDTHITKFVIGFVTQLAEPETDFARHFFTVRARAGVGES
eukprot:TRINITY_DN64122_c0_g1_i1.p1 TRINITY_DN64122_c0_g1~~TRINITY_DN64122_c0_g1_i1.p1  ORF type:complete len:575 (-),score=99.29 TRINITY_DN64122_c0_g1_i1:125-1849(-)